MKSAALALVLIFILSGSPSFAGETKDTTQVQTSSNLSATLDDQVKQITAQADGLGMRINTKLYGGDKDSRSNAQFILTALNTYKILNEQRENCGISSLMLNKFKTRIQSRRVRSSVRVPAQTTDFNVSLNTIFYNFGKAGNQAADPQFMYSIFRSYEAEYASPADYREQLSRVNKCLSKVTLN